MITLEEFEYITKQYQGRFGSIPENGIEAVSGMMTIIDLKPARDRLNKEGLKKMQAMRYRMLRRFAMYYGENVNRFPETLEVQK
jgi:hypothetical protein